MTPLRSRTPAGVLLPPGSARRLLLRVSIAAWLLGLVATPAFAQNPTFLQGPNFGTVSPGEVAIPLRASGGANPGTYTWSVVAGALPPGVSLRTDTDAFPSFFPANTNAALLGVATTPSATPYTFTLRVTSGGTFADQNATLRVSPLTITEPWTLPRGYVGKPFSYQLKTENGSAAVTWSTSQAASLASRGLTLSPQGLISGTPTASAFLGITLTATDGATTVSRGTNIEIFNIEITSPSVLPNAIQGEPYQVTLTSSGGSAPYTYSTSFSLPAGLTLDPVNGTISGTSTAGRGPFSFLMTVTDANSVSSWKYLSIDTVRAPQGAPRLSPYSGWWQDCTLGWPCDLGISVFAGGTAPFTFAISGQPRGLFLSATDSWTPTDVRITGAPVELGDFNIQVTVTDAVGISTTNTFPLHVSRLLQRGDSFKPLDLVDGRLDVPYSKKLSITGGALPYSVRMFSGQLPPGLSLDPSTSIVSGTPTAAGGFSPDFEYTDSAGNRLRVNDFLFIDGSFTSGGLGTIDINSFFDLGTATLNAFSSRVLSACCVPSYLWTAIDPLPPGLTLSADGTLSGAPTVEGVYTFKIRAADGQFPAANYAEQRFTLRVAAPTTSPITISTTTLPFGNVGTPYSVQIAGTSTAGTIAWTLAEANYLPPGLALVVDGTLSGTPTHTGQFTFSIVATDQGGNTLTRGFTMFVYPAGATPPLDLNIGPNLGTFAVAQSTTNLAATGGVPPYQYSLTPGASLVPGMRVQSGQPLPVFGTNITGAFTGIFTQPGSYSTSIRVVDSVGNILDRAVTLTVLPLQILSISPLPRASVGTPYSFTFTPFGFPGTSPFTWSATQMPQGMAMTTGGTLQGTPSTAGNFSVRVVLRDLPSSIELVQTFTLSVDPFAIDTSGDLPQGRLGVPYNQPLSATGCVNCTWTTTALPGGLTLSTSGLLSGTPTATSTGFSFTVQAVGTNGTAQKLFRMQIASSAQQPLSIATTQANFTDRTLGGTVTTALGAQGGTPPYTWSLESGALPTGMRLEQGETLSANLQPGVTHVAGRTMEPGLYTFTLRVTDAVGDFVTRSFTLRVAPLNFGYTTLPINNAFFSNPLVLDAPYNQPLLGIGGTTGIYTWTNNAPMPPGLTLNGGIVSGTPLNTGSFSVPMTLTDDAGNSFTGNVTFNVASPTGTAINFGQAANIGTIQKVFTLNRNLSLSGGTPPYNVVAETPLPPGIELNGGDGLQSGAPSGSWFLLGTPFVEGTFTFRLRATDSAGNVGARTFTVTVAPFGLITSTALADGSVGVPYSQALFAAVDNGSVTWSLAVGSTLPPGFAVTPSGTISGTPTQAGTFSFAMTATHSSGISINFTFSIRISSLAITGPSILPPAQTNVPYSYTFAATGSSGTLVWSGLIPLGLVMNPNGTISGTATAQAATSNFIVTVTDGVSTVSRRFTLFIVAQSPQPLTSVARTVLADVTVGQSFTLQLNHFSGLPPYTFSIAPGSALPPGLQLVSGALLPQTFAPGLTLIAGAPTAVGLYNFDLIVTDSSGAQVLRRFTMRVSPLSIVTGSLRAATVGTPYAQQFNTVGGAPPYTYSIAPQSFVSEMLPPGVSMSPTGLISGTPIGTGNFQLVVTARDLAGNTFTRLYSLVVTNAAGQFVLTGNLADTSVGTGRQQTLSVSAAVGTTFTWSLVGGALPPGMSLVSGGAFPGPNQTALVGRPSAAGVYTYTLRATDNANAANIADRFFTLRVAPMQVVTPPVELFNVDLPAGTIGVPYSATVKVAGGGQPYTLSVSQFSAMPPGLTLSATGTISGTPTEAGSYSIGLVITDANNHMLRSTAVSLVTTAPGVAPPLLPFGGPVPLNSGTIGVPYLAGALDAWVRFGRAPYSWSLAAGSALPSGLALLPGANGVSDRLSGIPTASGTYAFSLDAHDASGQTARLAFTLAVSNLALTPVTVSPGRVGVSYSVQFAPSGGTAPYNVQLTATNPPSDLPPGLTLSSGGLLSGIPTHAGNFTVAFTVTDSTGAQFFRFIRLTIDNASGEAPAASMTPRAIQVLHVQGVSTDSPVPVGVTTTSGSLPFNIHVAGIPGATLSAQGGTTPGAVNLNLGASARPPGTYTGLIGLSVPGSANLFDEVPVTLTVAPPPPCTFTLIPSSGTAPAGGGPGSFDVSTPTHCAWAATTPDSWIKITAGASGIGADTVAYSVLSSPTPFARTGSIVVNGNPFSITQFGSFCSFALLPPSITATAAGGTALVDVVASASGCSWTASSLDMAVAPGGGTGSRTVSVTVPPNTLAASRVLRATIAGQLFTVNQSGIDCIVTLSPYDATIPAAGGGGSVAVTTPAGCNYGTTVGPNWITVTSGASGVGPGTLVYSVAPNSTTVARSGSLSIGGQTFTVNQLALGCSVTLTPSLANPFGSTGGAGSVAIATNGSNCVWNASSDSPWATVLPLTGTGNGTVFLTVGSNANSATARAAGITINGQLVTLNQAGTVCTYALQSSNGSVPSSGGSGSVGVIAPAVCGWTAVTTAPTWLSITASGTAGTADVAFVAQPNLAAVPRMGTLTIAGLTYTVNQAAAACSYTTTPPLLNIAETGAIGASFNISTTAVGCTPSVQSYANWITVTNTTFVGNAGSVTFDVTINPGNTTRVGSIQVGDATFTVRQTGATCGYSLQAYGALFDKNGGDGNVLGSPSALGCTPTTGTTQPSFITLHPLAGPVTNVFTQGYSVLPFDVLNRVVRTGHINFGGLLFTVKQKSY